jgi:hypothetical protein
MSTALLTSLFLLGCPDAPETTGSTTQAVGQQDVQQQNNPGTMRERGKPLKEQPEMKGGFSAGGKIIQSSIIIKINESGKGDPSVKITQDQLKEQESVAFSGELSCTGDGCSDPMILRVVPFFEQKPGEKSKDEKLGGGIITKKKLGGVGAFDILVPKGKKAMVLELLVDGNSDGMPSVGERFAVLERGGQLIPSKDIGELNLDATDKEIEGSMGKPQSNDVLPPIGK